MIINLVALNYCGETLLSVDYFESARVVAKTLKKAGHEVFFAGGCVRDFLLKREPGDVDIATSARPGEVQRLFRRSLSVGKQFGVIVVLIGDEQFDVATFRSDGAYTDGRHPETVEFSSAEEDVQRRDFTMNGLLMDPQSMEIVDWVGGVEDLEKRSVRAIGDANKRFSEDRLRILRALRFACRYGFEIEENTGKAIRELASHAADPSAERIFSELNKMMTEADPHRALKLLVEFDLLQYVLPEVAAAAKFELAPRLGATTNLEYKLGLLSTVDQSQLTPGLVWAILLADLEHGPAKSQAQKAGAILQGLRASKALIKEVSMLVLMRDRLLFATRNSAARQRLFAASEWIDKSVILVRAHRDYLGSQFDDRLHAIEELSSDRSELPAPLLQGGELIAAGVERGPALGRCLKRIRFLQLEGKLTGRKEALDWLLARGYRP